MTGTAKTQLMPNLSSVGHLQALQAASKFEISAYDARFVALAVQLRVRLVTEDRKLRTAVPPWTISLADALA
jgi:predicted nucleic acid-binding protein